MSSKLDLDKKLIDRARASAAAVADEVQGFIDLNTTVSVERTVCRLLGVDGANEYGVPYSNVIVDSLMKKDALSLGAARRIADAVLATGLSPEEIAKRVDDGSLDLATVPPAPDGMMREYLRAAAEKTCARISQNRKSREDFIKKHGEKDRPYIYVIVATGNIYEDVVQAKAAARQGADVIAVIRTTGQSLLDYVPYGATTEGFGGTYATQENFKIMREALDEVSIEQGRYIRLCNYCSGLCMPEIAAMGALERLDMMLNDALYGILFRDINMKRTLIDQYFSRIINGYAGVIINTGEDNYLTTADAVEEAHTVLASQFLNEQFAAKAGIPECQMGLGHAFEISPRVENGFLYELAQAQMAREIFPDAPLKYMPPTKFMTGDIFMGNVQDALFNMVTIMTGQKVHLLGMLTEAIHTPFMSDRAAAIENAEYIFGTMKDLGDEISFKDGGIIRTRAAEVLGNAAELLCEIERKSLFKALEQGVFANISRGQNDGKGLDGVVRKAPGYINPFIEIMLEGVAR